MTTTSMTTAPVAAPRRARTPWAALVLIGAIGGVLSGLFAIGGAIVMVPLLEWRAGMDQRRAAATSLVAIVPTAIVSSATYLVHADVDVGAAAFISAGAAAIPSTSAPDWSSGRPPRRRRYPRSTWPSRFHRRCQP